jgi:hypothetical protein
VKKLKEKQDVSKLKRYAENCVKEYIYPSAIRIKRG